MNPRSELCVSLPDILSISLEYYTDSHCSLPISLVLFKIEKQNTDAPHVRKKILSNLKYGYGIIISLTYLLTTVLLRLWLSFVVEKLKTANQLLDTNRNSNHRQYHQISRGTTELLSEWVQRCISTQGYVIMMCIVCQQVLTVDLIPCVQYSAEGASHC